MEHNFDAFHHSSSTWTNSFDSKTICWIFSKRVYILPVEITSTSEDVTRHFLRYIFCLQGMLGSFIYKNSQITSSFWAQLIDCCIIRLKLGYSEAHPNQPLNKIGECNSGNCLYFYLLSPVRLKRASPIGWICLQLYGHWFTWYNHVKA